MGSIPVRGVRFFLYFKRPAPALGSSQDHIQSVIIAFSSSEVKRPEHKPDH